MEPVAKIVRCVILLLCAALFLAGVVWNLCNPPQETEQNIAASELQETSHEKQQEEAVGVLFQQSDIIEMQDAQSAQEMENRMASLRMQRDASWQQLYHAVEQLEFAEKQQKLHQYAELQYKEQRLELLLNAKGMQHCLTVLEPEQANIIVSAEQLQTEYEKLYDLVLRNTDYTESQIVLVPLK